VVDKNKQTDFLMFSYLRHRATISTCWLAIFISWNSQWQTGTMYITTGLTVNG